MPTQPMLLQKLKSSVKKRYVVAGLVILAIAIIGTTSIIATRAATYVVAVEAESGALSGNHKIADAAGASGIKAISFGTNATPPATPPTPPTNPPTPPAGMPAITRDGTKLMRDGKQWKFAGMTATGFGVNSCVPPGESAGITDANIDAYFSGLNPHSVTLIRPYKGTAVQAALDKIVAAAEQHNQYLAFAFFDGNKNCGSPGTGTAAANLETIKPLIQRYAKDTGTRKTNAIAFWQLTSEGDAAGAAWMKTMADGVKQLDPKTLVSTGAALYNPTAASTLHAADSIDLISMSDFSDGCAIPASATSVITAAQSLNKPWYAASFNGGFKATTNPYQTDTDDSAKCLSDEWKSYLANASNAGALYWDLSVSATPASTTIGSLTTSKKWTAAKAFRHDYQGN